MSFLLMQGARRFPRDEAEHGLLARRFAGRPFASVLKELKEL